MASPRFIAAVLACIAGATVSASFAFPRAPVDAVWQDMHDGYPPVPNGLTAIRRLFGEACTADSIANTTSFIAADNGRPYAVHFHKLLGGVASSNLDNDIPGHITRARLDSKVLSEIGAYNCRLKRSSSKEYSAHAWGIAVDINTSKEVPGQKCRSIPPELGSIWTKHNWRWGAAWLDCMHFQYATGY